MRNTKLALIGSLATLALVGAGCGTAKVQTPAQIPAPAPQTNTPERFEFRPGPDAEWTYAGKSPDGKWTVYSTPNPAGDPHIRLAGPSGTMLEIPGISIVFGKSAFSPDSKHLLAQNSSDDNNPNPSRLIDIRLTVPPAVVTVTPASGSLELPSSYTSASWNGNVFRFTTPMSSYNPKRITDVDLAASTYMTRDAGDK